MNCLAQEMHKGVECFSKRNILLLPLGALHNARSYTFQSIFLLPLWALNGSSESYCRLKDESYMVPSNQVANTELDHKIECLQWSVYSDHNRKFMHTVVSFRLYLRVTFPYFILLIYSNLCNSDGSLHTFESEFCFMNHLAENLMFSIPSNVGYNFPCEQVQLFIPWSRV